MVEIRVRGLQQVFSCTVGSLAMTRMIASNLRRRKLERVMPVILMVMLTGKNMCF
jgi:hypothetical protein